MLKAAVAFENYSRISVETNPAIYMPKILAIQTFWNHEKK